MFYLILVIALFINSSIFSMKTNQKIKQSEIELSEDELQIVQKYYIDPNNKSILLGSYLPTFPLALIKLCLKQGADINASDGMNNNALHDFCFASNFLSDESVEKALLLIRNGININQMNEDGDTPFQLLKLKHHQLRENEREHKRCTTLIEEMEKPGGDIIK